MAEAPLEAAATAAFTDGGETPRSIASSPRPCLSALYLQMFSKYMARFFKIYGPPGTVFRTGFTTCGVDKKVSTTTVSTSRWGSQHGFRGVSMVIMPDATGYDRRHKSIEGGSRWVEAGLRGHDDGVSMVDEGVENTSIRLRKPGRLAVSE